MSSRFHKVTASQASITFSSDQGNNIERLKKLVEVIWHNAGVDSFEKNQINIYGSISNVRVFDPTKKPPFSLGVKIETFTTDKPKKESWERTILEITDTVVSQSKATANVIFSDGKIVLFTPPL